jgi:hypothetical protein
MTRAFITDGMKSSSLLTSNDPDIWQGLSGMSGRERDVYYARVAAVFRAFNLKANTVGNMPFCLVKQSQKDAVGKPKSVGIKAIDDTEEGEYFDESATWENKVGFLPNPSELFRLDTLSYMATNTIYNLRTSDALGYKVKGLYHAVATTFTPWQSGDGTTVDYIERHVGSTIERYTFPEDKRLVRMWRLDHTSELLPSPNTEMLAIMEAAGIVYYKNFWIQNFYRRGGIKPTLISIKGLVDKESREEKERGWSNWLRGIGKVGSNIARLINGENMSATTIGDGIGDMKNNKTHEEALADIAMGTGMPLSLLMANSANYATAKEEKATWYENDIIPLCNWLAYEYNRQVFEPIGLRLEFHPETLDPQQEDETERAQAMMQYASVIEKVQTAELFFGLAAMMGLEVPDELHAAIETFYEDKAQKEEEMREQMSQGGYTVGPDGKPIPAAPIADGEKPTTEPGKKPAISATADEDDDAEDEDEEDEEEEDKKPAPFAKKAWTPSLDELEEMRVYREVALRKHKKGESLDFVYEPHHGGLPAEYAEQVKAKLLTATTAEEVKAAFVVAETVTPAPVYVSDATNDILVLAAAINKLAEKG